VIRAKCKCSYCRGNHVYQRLITCFSDYRASNSCCVYLRFILRDNTKTAHDTLFWMEEASSRYATCTAHSSVSAKPRIYHQTEHISREPLTTDLKFAGPIFYPNQTHTRNTRCNSKIALCLLLNRRYQPNSVPFR